MARMQREDKPQQSPHDGTGADRRQRISEAAYHRWERRGGDHGGDQQDWFDAESEIDGKDGSPGP